MRGRRILLAAISVAAFVGACGGDKATPLDTVQAASTETAGGETASVVMTINGGQGSLKDVTFTGAYDFTERLMSFEIDASKLGLEGVTGTIDAIMDFSDAVVQYMKFPGLEEETGKEWMRIDVGAAITEICPDIDFAALLNTQSGDPTAGLTSLEGAKSVKELGTETVRGEQTKHYRVTVDIRDVAENAPEEAREAMKEFASWYVDPIQTSEVWIDDDGRARRLETTTDSANLKLPDCLGGAQSENPFQGKTTVSMELFDFGKDVDIEVPPANDVIDLAELGG